jgi:hypothetical protein
MGWHYMKSLKGHSGPHPYLDASSPTSAPTRYRKCCARRLSACVSTMPPWNRSAWPLVSARSWAPSASSATIRADPGGYIFGYKDKEEGMEPHDCDCPEPILDLLTLTSRQYALQWRTRCRSSRQCRETEPACGANDHLRRTAILRRCSALR